MSKLVFFIPIPKNICNISQPIIAAHIPDYYGSNLSLEWQELMFLRVTATTDLENDCFLLDEMFKQWSQFSQLEAIILTVYHDDCP